VFPALERFLRALPSENGHTKDDFPNVGKNYKSLPLESDLVPPVEESSISLYPEFILFLTLKRGT
jgi:hypothetical protein